MKAIVFNTPGLQIQDPQSLFDMDCPNQHTVPAIY